MQYDLLKQQIVLKPRVWLVTGVAGFIGSHILEELLNLGQKVIGVDNFLTGSRDNLTKVKNLVTRKHWEQFRFYELDICADDIFEKLDSDIDIVLHQAALGSVPRSIKVPQNTHKNNVEGYINILEFCRLKKISRFIYASSSSVYGDHPSLPKKEDVVGNVLSPYGLTKKINELYAEQYFNHYGLEAIGLRYFNVFGERQNPQGAYAAVIPKWFQLMYEDKSIEVFGDGTNSRDFCYVKNAVQANILAGLTESEGAFGQVFNVAYGEQNSLLKLYQVMAKLMHEYSHKEVNKPIIFKPPREGDICHSLANIQKAKTILGYSPLFSLENGIEKIFESFFQSQNSQVNIQNNQGIEL